MNTENLTLIVLRATSGQEALRHIYAYRKALDPKFSLAYIARRVSIKSRGTLSLILRGERAIPNKLRRPLLSVLTGDDLLTDYLELQLDYDHASSESSRQDIETRLKTLSFYLQDRFANVHLQHGMTLLASDILCAFDIFSGKPTERQLIDFFGKTRFRDVQTAIRILLLNGLVERTDEHLQRTQLTRRFLTLNDQDQNQTLTYLKESIYDAYQNAGKWAADVDMSCFGSTTMSVRKQTYREVIKRLKKDVLRYFSDLETADGDTLIRFNMQIFPLQPP